MNIAKRTKTITIIWNVLAVYFALLAHLEILNDPTQTTYQALISGLMCSLMGFCVANILARFTIWLFTPEDKNRSSTWAD